MLNSIKTMAVSAVAPVVKLFPAWALRHTQKGNFYASYFLLSHKREMKILSETPNYRFRRMAEHLWRPETRLKCLADGRLYELFVDGIRNSKEFYAAFNNETAQDRAVASKGYTLSNDEIVHVCNSDKKWVPVLLKKQSGSFYDKTVARLSGEARTMLFGRLVVGYSVDILQGLDKILRQDALFATGDLQKTAAAAMSLLFKNKTYRPNIPAEQLVQLPDFNVWADDADSLAVANKMANYWLRLRQYDLVERLIERLINDRHRAAADQLLTALPNEISVRLSDKLCRPETLLNLAKEDKLPLALYDLAAPELQQRLFDIMEENAQVKWFKPLAEQGPRNDVAGLLKCIKINGKKIGGKVQDMSLENPAWAEIFAAEGFYDDEHIVKLMRSGNKQAILLWGGRNNLNQKQYTALLFGPCAYLEPQMKYHGKK